MVDGLRALFLSVYAIDQIDVTDKWKVRVGLRPDYWSEELTPQVCVPAASRQTARRSSPVPRRRSSTRR